jgi:hypothetical protein
MKSFLVKDKVPIIKWSMLPKETYFEGTVPEGYSLAVVPSKGYVVVDIDRHGNIDGFDNIPSDLQNELAFTLNYNTKNNGKHCWFKYTGDKPLGNKTSGLGIDLRVGQKGYVVYYPDNDIRKQLHLINGTSPRMNKWLEKLFSYV